jgi:hypothetical protein
MEHLRTTLIVGAALFFGGAALIGCAFLHYLWRMRRALREYSAAQYETHVAKTIWIYLVLFNACLAAGLLYMAQYYGQGFSLKSTMEIVVWARWIYYGVVGSLYVGLLAYVLTPAPHGAQSFFAVALYAAAMLLGVYVASLAQTRETELLWILPACFWFLEALALQFFPVNRIFGDALYDRARDVNFSEYSTLRLLFCKTRREQHEAVITLWAFLFRLIFLVQLVVSHLGLLITWFLSDSQAFSDAADLHATLVAYLVFDALLLLPVTALFSVLSFCGVVRRLSARSRDTGHKIVT